MAAITLTWGAVKHFHDGMLSSDQALYFHGREIVAFLPSSELVIIQKPEAEAAEKSR